MESHVLNCTCVLLECHKGALLHVPAQLCAQCCCESCSVPLELCSNKQCWSEAVLLEVCSTCVPAFACALPDDDMQ